MYAKALMPEIYQRIINGINTVANHSAKEWRRLIFWSVGFDNDSACKVENFACSRPAPMRMPIIPTSVLRNTCASRGFRFASIGMLPQDGYLKFATRSIPLFEALQAAGVVFA